MDAEVPAAAPNGGSARGYARLFGALRTVGNPDHGGAYSGEAVFLCIASTRRELPLLPRTVRSSEAVGCFPQCLLGLTGLW